MAAHIEYRRKDEDYSVGYFRFHLNKRTDFDFSLETLTSYFVDRFVSACVCVPSQTKNRVSPNGFDKIR